MDKNLEHALENHRELWEIIGELCEGAVNDPDSYDYDDGDDIKMIAIGKMGYFNNKILYNCFCCDYARHYSSVDNNKNCAKCPVDWGVEWYPECGDTPCCLSLYGDYDDYVYDSDFEGAAKIAYEIANLPINPIYKEEE